jgi:cyclic pyranopterin phosphate synthase
MGMIDVGGKPVVRREAVATGKIFLSPSTIDVVRRGKAKKGDPLLTAEIAGMHAAKQTHVLIPHCHQVALDSVRVEFNLAESTIEAHCFVEAQARTGVEVEALTGLSIALTTLWDMVKYLEKDEEGQYPSTVISDIMVVKKVKIP